MQSARPLFTHLQICRCFSSSNVNSTFSRESRFMKKILQKSSKSNRKWYESSTNFRNTINVSSPAIRSPSTHTVRRMTVRNKLFMEHITDQISMGEASSIINGAIEVTHVEITPNFKHVNVFWNRATDTPISKEALKKCAGIIRHELSQLRVIGVVPPILFVENRQHFIKNEIEEKFAIIESDLEDFEILSFSEQMELATSHIDQVLHKIPVVNNNPEPDGPHIELPMMRHDVLGLDHYKIMTRIVVSMSKSKTATERRMLDMNTDNSPRNVTSNKVADFLTKKEQKELFKEFLNKRRIEERRMYRMKQLPNQQLNNSEEEMDYEENYDEKYDFVDENHDDDFEDKR